VGRGHSFLHCVILVSFFIFFLRDFRYIKDLEKFKHKIDYELKDLKEKPLVSFIIPAWKEEEFLEKCVISILNLNYSKKKIIINAGGNQKTIEIANSYKKLEDVIVIFQDKGMGKIKAINDALKYVDEGIVYLLDADVLINDQLLLSMIHPIIHQNESVVVSALKPYKESKDIDLVKYIFIKRQTKFRKKSKYKNSIGPNTVINYDLIRKIYPFTEGQYSDDNLVIAEDIIQENEKILHFRGYMGEIYIPIKFRELLNQNLRWIENSYFRNKKEGNIFYLLKFHIFLFISFIFVFSPILVIFNIRLLFLWILFLSAYYLKRIRKIIIFEVAFGNYVEFHYNILFFIKIILFIYMDVVIKIIAFFEILFFKNKYKKRKNLN